MCHWVVVMRYDGKQLHRDYLESCFAVFESWRNTLQHSVRRGTDRHYRVWCMLSWMYCTYTRCWDTYGNARWTSHRSSLAEIDPCWFRERPLVSRGTKFMCTERERAWLCCNSWISFRDRDTPEINWLLLAAIPMRIKYTWKYIRECIIFVFRIIFRKNVCHGYKIWYICLGKLP